MNIQQNREEKFCRLSFKGIIYKKNTSKYLMEDIENTTNKKITTSNNEKNLNLPFYK